jgi:8-amino-7-oxononanoate synthase
MYEKELKAIKNSNRFRQRQIFDEDLVDFASNDYLGLAENRDIFKKAYDRVLSYKTLSPKASQLVNGYHPIHKEFELYLSEINGFEDGIVVGSGFLANLSLIEALPRKKDLLILDELYHASGMLSSKLVDAKVVKFRHNDPKDLQKILKDHEYQRAIVCVEGIYSMDGDMVDKEIFDICDDDNIILIVDEAHSSGVVGDNLLGVFEYLDIEIKSNHIKMGTLGKAYGSYGAYILASSEIISYLQNRAKAIIYTTAPSIFDISLALESVQYIQKNSKIFKDKIKDIVKLVEHIFGIKMEGLILKIEIDSSKKVLDLKEYAKNEGFLIGAIRPPTVKSSILRIIPRVNSDIKVLEKFLWELKEEIYRK